MMAITSLPCPPQVKSQLTPFTKYFLTFIFAIILMSVHAIWIVCFILSAGILTHGRIPERQLLIEMASLVTGSDNSNHLKLRWYKTWIVMNGKRTVDENTCISLCIQWVPLIRSKKWKMEKKLLVVVSDCNQLSNFAINNFDVKNIC